MLGAGVDIVQLREKGLEAADEMRLLEVFAPPRPKHGALFAVNDRADVAYAVGAPVLHLGQDDLPVPVARRIVGPDVIIGRSTHSPEQADAAMIEPGVDYFCCGPTWATPTKPGRPAAGLALLAHVARPRPSGRGSRSVASSRSSGWTRCSRPARAGSSWCGRSPRPTIRPRPPGAFADRLRWRQESRGRTRQKCPTGPSPAPSGYESATAPVM